MILLRDAATLALTKLRTRKVRLFITVLVSGLLFTGLATASMIARGSFASIEDFSEEGFSKRYIISGSPQMDVFGLMTNQEVMTRATSLHKETIARKKAEAKRLGITYNEETDMPPVQEYDTGAGKERSLDFMHPAAKVAIAEHMAAHPGPGMPEFRSTAEKYGATGYFENVMRPFASDGSSLQVLKGGKEEYSTNTQQSGPPSGVDSFVSSWQGISSGLLDPFLLPGQKIEDSEDDAVPIVIPVDAAEQLLGLTALPASASSEEKLERIKTVRSMAGNLRFEVCYRNNTSAGLISSAISAQQEIDQNKDNKEFQKPELIYGLPTEPCGTSPVLRDVRSAAVKKSAAKQEEFERIFGKKAPEQSMLKFRVVGIVPGFDFGAASSVSQIISSLLVSSLGTGWYTPLEHMAADTKLNGIFNGEPGTIGAMNSYFAEFSTANQAKSFMETESCTPDYSKQNYAEAVKVCEDSGKYFAIRAYGSNSLGLEDVKNGFSKIFRIAALVIAVIAAVIMMGTVGRMIADSRRETAVFRAIGAKKIDIAQIYVLYTIMLSVLIALFAIVVGFSLATFANSRFSEAATVEALVSYNAQDLNRTFKLYSFYWPDMFYLIGLTLVSGIISSVIPLLRNLRRNPIRDMRDDT